MHKRSMYMTDTKMVTDDDNKAQGKPTAGEECPLGPPMWWPRFTSTLPSSACYLQAEASLGTGLGGA